MRQTDTYLSKMLGLPSRPLHNLPSPPFHVFCSPYAAIAVEFDRTAIRKVLPDFFVPADEPRGFMAAYRAPSGSAIAPYTGFYVAIEVKGHDASDGSPGHFQPLAWYSDLAGDVAPRIYSSLSNVGFGFHERDGDVVTAGGGVDGRRLVSFSLRSVAEPMQMSGGVHTYLGLDPKDGSPNIWAVAWASRPQLCEPLSYEIEPDAPALFQMLRPTRLLAGVDQHDLSITWSPPAGADEGAARAIAREKALLLINAFSRLGHAALVVNRDLQVQHINEAAKPILGDGIVVSNGVLRLRQETEHTALGDAVARCLSQDLGTLSLTPVTVSRRLATTPLLVQALPVNAPSAEPLVILLLTDPKTADRRPTETLQLLGLTVSEARIAVEIGMGLSARSAADKLAISEHTARSSLKVIYEKLAITKQSELARVVTRLAVLTE